MPLNDTEKHAISNYFFLATEHYKQNLRCLQSIEGISEKLKNQIQIEIDSMDIWNGIKQAAITYADTVKDEEELLNKPRNERTTEDIDKLSTLYQIKEKAIKELADRLQQLITQCGIPFTNPSIPFIFWGNDAGELQAYKDSECGTKANVVAAASVSIFNVLLGPCYFGGSTPEAEKLPKEVNFHFTDNPTGNKVALRDLFYREKAPTEPTHLPDCNRMLWAAMSKLYADSAIKSAKQAIMEGKKAPEFTVYLPTQIDRDSNFWLWELPIITEIQQAKIKITYKKLSPVDQSKWINANFEYYMISRRYKAKVSDATQPGEIPDSDSDDPNRLPTKKESFEGKAFYTGLFPSISINKLRKMVNKIRKFTDNKDRKRPLSVMLRVLEGLPSTQAGSQSYQDSGRKTHKDLTALKKLSDSLDKIWQPNASFKENSNRAIEYLLESFYNLGKSKKYSLDSEKIPQTITGQLKLMQIAKQYHHYQLIIDLYKQHSLNNIKNSIQAKELVIWALNRRGELLIQKQDRIFYKIETGTDKLASLITEAENTLEEAIRIGQEVLEIDPYNKSVLFEKARNRSMASYYNKSISKDTALDIYKQNVLTYADIASGGKYIQELGERIKYQNMALDQINYADLKDIAEKTYAIASTYGVNEITEFAILRSAYLAALVLNDPLKIACIVKRMKQTPIPDNELSYFPRFYYPQLKADNTVEIHRVNDNPHTKAILESQKNKAYQTFRDEEAKSQDPEQQFLRLSYDYRKSLETYYGGVQRGGNIRFGGVLPQQLITKSDISIFTKLLSTSIGQLIPTQAALQHLIAQSENPIANRFFDEAFVALYGKEKFADKTLLSIEDPDMALKAMRFIVALNFQSIGDSSDPNKAMYRRLDYAMSAFNRITTDLKEARDEHYDSATSLSIMFGIQVGDCRHHAESMQLLFDTWKNHQLLQALNINNSDRFESLNDTQLRVIDTLEECDTGDDNKEFAYAHTFNVLQKPDENGKKTYTVYDAFDLDQSPQRILFKLENAHLEFSTQKVSAPTKFIRYRFTAYAGAKGDSKAIEDLSLLGRTGITEQSVIQSIINCDVRQETQGIISNIAQKEQNLSRSSMSLDNFYDMMIVKGYLFEDKKNMPATLSIDKILLIKQFLYEKGYPKNTKATSAILSRFYTEIEQRTDLIEKLEKDASIELTREELKLFDQFQSNLSDQKRDELIGLIRKNISYLPCKSEQRLRLELLCIKLEKKTADVPPFCKRDIKALSGYLSKQVSQIDPDLMNALKESEATQFVKKIELLILSKKTWVLGGLIGHSRYKKDDKITQIPKGIRTILDIIQQDKVPSQDKISAILKVAEERKGNRLLSIFQIGLFQRSDDTKLFYQALVNQIEKYQAITKEGIVYTHK